MKWRNVILVALLSLPLLVVLALGFGHDPREVPSVLPGKPAPPCTLRALAGGDRALSDFLGKPLVVNFWSTWCVPCEAEHHLLQQSAQIYGERVQFVGVVYQDEPEAAKKYLARKGGTYPQFSDPDSRCAIEYGVAGVPETFFIDRTGKVADKQVGPVSPGQLTRVVGGLITAGTP